MPIPIACPIARQAPEGGASIIAQRDSAGGTLFPPCHLVRQEKKFKTSAALLKLIHARDKPVGVWGTTRNPTAVAVGYG